MKILTSVLRSTITAVLLVAVTAGFGLTSHAALVSIDFGPGAVEPGFDSFPAGGTNSKTFGGVTVSLSTFGDGLAGNSDRSETIDQRDRGAPADNGSFTQGDLLRDFVFADHTDRGGGEGLDVTISGLASNAAYGFVLWSNEGATTGVVPQFTGDWTANGTPIAALTGHNPGGPAPTSDLNDFRKEFNATSDGAGVIVPRGVDSGIHRSAHPLNGLQIIPEPTSMVLLALGFAAMIGATRRR